MAVNVSCCMCILFIALRTTVQATGCNDAPLLRELEKRARNSGEHSVNDLYLTTGWYTTNNTKGQHKMPDSNTKPMFFGCGTHYPFYINGTHPKVLNDTPVPAVACARMKNEDCVQVVNIQIRNCDGILQYRLVKTIRYGGYCFDPPNIQNETDFSEAPTGFTPGSVTVTPYLLWTEKKDPQRILIPFLYFKCSFTATKGLMYYISWNANGQRLYFYGPSNDTDAEQLHLHADKLVEKNYHLGINVHCDVQAARDETGILTKSYPSDRFFAGIRVVNPTILIDSSEDFKNISLKATVPVGFANLDGKVETRTLAVHMTHPDNSCTTNIPLAYKHCSVQIEPQTISSTWNPNVEYFFQVTMAFKNIEKKDIYYLHLETGDFEDRFYAGQPLQTVYIKAAQNSKPLYCYSHVDPHIKTFDGVHYDCQVQGRFLLYKNTKYPIEVQHQTSSCNNGIPTCTCAVAIRAGADVFMLNRCDNKVKFDKFMKCDDHEILEVQLSNTDTKYIIKTPIGTKIVITLLSGNYQGFLDVDIYSSPKDKQNTEGWCGFYDGSGNEKLRDGSDVNPKVNPEHFCLNWRIATSEDLFNGSNYNYIQPWTYNNSLFCDCVGNETNNEAVCNNSRCTSPTGTNRPREQCQHGTIGTSSVDSKNIELLYSSSNVVIANRRKRDIAQKHKSVRSLPDYKLTEDDAKGNCTMIINNVTAIHDFPERVTTEMIANTIDECIFDVLEMDDISVADVQAASINAHVSQMLTYEPAFVANNIQKVSNFRRKICPNNCNNKGNCTDEGHCVCNSRYYGPGCQLFDGDPIDVVFVYDEGVCNKAIDGDCGCFWFFTENLAPYFKCKFVLTQVNVHGEKTTVGSHEVSGHFIDMFSGRCCMSDTDRRKRSTDSAVLGYEYYMSISNDGVTFGTGQTLYVIDGTCMNAVTNTSTGAKELVLQSGYCLIGGQCVADSMTMSNCQNTCKTDIDRFTWTSEKGRHQHVKRNEGKCTVCTGNDKEDLKISFFCKTKPQKIIVISVVTVVVGVIIAGVVIVCFKKSCSNVQMATTLEPNTEADRNLQTTFNMREVSVIEFPYCTISSNRSDPEHTYTDLDDITRNKDKRSSRPQSASSIRVNF